MRTRVGVNHPEHLGYWLGKVESPIIPAEPRGWAGFLARRACRKAGGHWWHSVDAMTAWGCCNCGARSDGMPFDGS